MKINLCLLLSLFLITGCKTEETDEFLLLGKEVSFKVTAHLYPGTEVKSIALCDQDNWF